MSKSEHIVVDIEDLRTGEIEEIEDYLGMAFDDIFADGNPRGKALRTIAWIFKRRENPDFTLEEAGNLVLKLEESATDPTSPAV